MAERQRSLPSQLAYCQAEIARSASLLFNDIPFDFTSLLVLGIVHTWMGQTASVLKNLTLK